MNPPVILANQATSSNVASNERAAALRVLIKNGLMFGEAVNIFAEDSTPEELAYAAQAREKHRFTEGNVEVADPTIVSVSNDGAYVLAWTWVDDPSPASDA